jgi:hypothetical protein
MRVKFLQESSVSKQAALQLEAKIHELEGQCGLEEASRVRAEVTYQIPTSLSHVSVAWVLKSLNLAESGGVTVDSFFF